MRRAVLNFRTILLRSVAIPILALTVGVGGAIAQSGTLRAQEQPKQPGGQSAQPSATDAARDSQRRSDEFGEAAQAINGPAGNPECVWVGRRVVLLMWRDDIDTAFRHLELYDRFGCPAGHVQATFRCLTRFGPIDPKAPDSLSGRVHACWVNPNAQPQAAGSQAPAPAAAGGPPAAAAPAEQK